MEKEAPPDYFNMWRGFGDGPIRIGKKIDIETHSLYSLLYISCVRKEYIQAALGKHKKAQEINDLQSSLNLEQDKNEDKTEAQASDINETQFEGREEEDQG